MRKEAGKGKGDREKECLLASAEAFHNPLGKCTWSFQDSFLILSCIKEPQACCPWSSHSLTLCVQTRDFFYAKILKLFCNNIPIFLVEFIIQEHTSWFLHGNPLFFSHFFPCPVLHSECTDICPFLWFSPFSTIILDSQIHQHTSPLPFSTIRQKMKINHRSRTIHNWTLFNTLYRKSLPTRQNWRVRWSMFSQSRPRMSKLTDLDVSINSALIWLWGRTYFYPCSAGYNKIDFSVQYYAEYIILSVVWTCLFFLEWMQIQYLRVYKGHNFQRDKIMLCFIVDWRKADSLWTHSFLSLLPPTSSRIYTGVRWRFCFVFQRLSHW